MLCERSDERLLFSPFLSLLALPISLMSTVQFPDRHVSRRHDRTSFRLYHSPFLNFVAWALVTYYRTVTRLFRSWTVILLTRHTICFALLLTRPVIIFLLVRKFDLLDGKAKTLVSRLTLEWDLTGSEPVITQDNWNSLLRQIHTTYCMASIFNYLNIKIKQPMIINST